MRKTRSMEILKVEKFFLAIFRLIRKDEDTANPFIAKTPDGEYYIVYATLTEEVYSSSTYNNAIDACYEMIIELKEKNLL